MNKKQPQPGEWWWVDEVLYIVGYTHSGNFIIEFADGKTEVCEPLSSYEFETWQHLPNCTGFDWVEPSARNALEKIALSVGVDPLGVDSHDLAEMIISSNKMQITEV